MDSTEKTIFVLALIAGAILGVILLYFIFTIVRQQKKTRRLHLEKMDAEIKALERERTRIANDLHDELGPLLSATKYNINAVDVTDSSDQQLIDKASKHIDDSITRIREISFDLMPSSLQRKGLIVTLEEFIPKAQKLFPVKISFNHRGDGNLSNEMVVNLYRIILEIIHNTVKHAQATELLLELVITDKKVILKTKDNGVGFNHGRMRSESAGLGLKNLVARTDVMRGELMLDSVAGQGTSYHIEIPL